MFCDRTLIGVCFVTEQMIAGSPRKYLLGVPLRLVPRFELINVVPVYVMKFVRFKPHGPPPEHREAYRLNYLLASTIHINGLPLHEHPAGKRFLQLFGFCPWWCPLLIVYWRDASMTAFDEAP